jgi:mannosyltransferase
VRSAAAGAPRNVRRIERVAWTAPVVALALGTIGLGSKSLWYDETYTAWATRGSWSRLWSIVRAHEGPHGAYYAVDKAFTDLAGHSEWALRLPSVVAAALAVLVVYLLGRRLLDPLTGAIASFAVAVNPFVVIWSQQARSYAFVLLAGSASTLALIHVLQRPAVTRWGLYALVASLGLVVHPFVGLVVPAHVVAVALRRPRVSLPPAVAAFAVVALVAARIAVAVGSRDEQLTAWIQQPGVGDVVEGLVLVAGISPLALAASAAGAFTARRLGVESWKQALLAAWALGPFAVTIAVSFVKPVFAPRYLVEAVPAFALLAALWLVNAGRLLAVAAGGAMLAWSAAVIALWYDARPLEDWRSATAATLAAARPGDDVLFAPGPAATGFEYYAGTEAAVSTPRARTAWLLVWGDSPLDRERSAQERMGPAYRLAERRTIDDWLSVERWTRRG